MHVRISSTTNNLIPACNQYQSKRITSQLCSIVAIKGKISHWWKRRGNILENVAETDRKENLGDPFGHSLTCVPISAKNQSYWVRYEESLSRYTLSCGKYRQY